MVGRVLHADSTNILDVASKEISGDDVNIENIHMQLIFVGAPLIEWMAPFCIMLVVETRFFWVIC